MNIKLKTDFIDYYDHLFDRKGTPFYRYSENSLSRFDMFKYMNNKDINTVEYGYPNDLYKYKDDYNGLVIYKDLYKHRGEGKELVDFDTAKQKYNSDLASLYIDMSTDNYSAISYRLLQIGKYRYWIEYKSRDGWRSNYGYVETDIVNEDINYSFTKIPEPLYAIDFVISNNELLAIDFNTSPGLKSIGLKEELSAGEVVNQIKTFYNRYSNEHNNNDRLLYFKKEKDIILNRYKNTCD